jgi:hypothetical protein
MKRLALLAAGTALAAIPAVIGLTGNPALSHRVPVRVPSGAVPVKVADTQPEVHRQGHGSDDASPSAGPARPAEPGDDKGGLVRHAEPGDDRDGSSGRSGTGTPGGTDDAPGHR